MRERPDLLAEAALDEDERALLDRWSREGADDERD
jgi:hypothetical protein